MKYTWVGSSYVFFATLDLLVYVLVPAISGSSFLFSAFSGVFSVTGLSLVLVFSLCISRGGSFVASSFDPCDFCCYHFLKILVSGTTSSYIKETNERITFCIVDVFKPVVEPSCWFSGRITLWHLNSRSSPKRLIPTFTLKVYCLPTHC